MLKTYEELKERFLEYEHGYIDDIIHEIADSEVAIYYKEIIENVEDLLHDHDMHGLLSGDEDLSKVIQVMEYQRYVDLMNEHKGDLIRSWCRQKGIDYDKLTRLDDKEYSAMYDTEELLDIIRIAFEHDCYLKGDES